MAIYYDAPWLSGGSWAGYCLPLETLHGKGLDAMKQEAPLPTKAFRRPDTRQWLNFWTMGLHQSRRQTKIEAGDNMSEENETIQDRFAFHREEILHIAQQLEDIINGRISAEAVNTELATLAGHLKRSADRIEVTENLVLAALDRVDLTRLASAVESVEKRLGEVEGRMGEVDSARTDK